MNRYKDDPKWITAKFNSKCTKCKETITRNARIFWYPKCKSVYCEKCGESESASFNNAAQDEAIYSGTSYESHDFGDNY